LDLQGNLQAKLEPIFRQELELYMLQQMATVSNLDSTLVSIHLKVNDEEEMEDGGGRSLQQQQQQTTLAYTGTAVLDTQKQEEMVDDGGSTTPVSLVNVGPGDQIALAQILTLENPDLLQEFIDSSSVTSKEEDNDENDDPLILQRISVSGRDPVTVTGSGYEDGTLGTGSSNNNAALAQANSKGDKGMSGALIGILIAVLLLVAIISILLVRQMHDKPPPPPPPLDSEVISYLDQDLDLEGSIKKMEQDDPNDPNLELAIKTTTTKAAPSPQASPAKKKPMRIFSPRNLLLLSRSSTTTDDVNANRNYSNMDDNNNNNNDDDDDDDDDSTIDDDGSPNSHSLAQAMSELDEVVASANVKSIATTDNGNNNNAPKSKSGGFFSSWKPKRPSLYSEPIADMSTKTATDQDPEPQLTLVELADDIDGSMEVRNISNSDSECGPAFADLSSDPNTQRGMAGYPPPAPPISSPLTGGRMTLPPHLALHKPVTRMMGVENASNKSNMTDYSDDDESKLVFSLRSFMTGEGDDDSMAGYSLADGQLPSDQMFSTRSLFTTGDQMMSTRSMFTTGDQMMSTRSMLSMGDQMMSSRSIVAATSTTKAPPVVVGGQRTVSPPNMLSTTSTAKATLGEPPSPPSTSPDAAGAGMRKWFSAPRSFLKEKEMDDPYGYTTSDSERFVATSDSDVSQRQLSRSGSHNNGGSSMIAQLGFSAAMSHPRGSNPSLMATEQKNGSIEVGRPDLFVDNESDDDDGQENDEELYNSSWKEDDNEPAGGGDASILSGLLSRASDMDGVYTTTGSMQGDLSTALSLPSRVHSGASSSSYRVSE
jgi:hypothetical protein